MFVVSQHQQQILQIFNAALKSVAGDVVVAKELRNTKYPDSFHLVAIGKAADAMVRGVPSERIKTGLLITKHGHFEATTKQDSRLLCIESDHPVPKENSINAGKALLAYLENLPENEPCLFLISGGASALVEVLQDDWSLKQLQALTDFLLAKAYPIDQINTIRRRLSKIKGGGLWSAIGNRCVYCLMISDVPDDDPAVIGSGLLFPAEETVLPDLPKEWADKINAYQQYHAADNFSYNIIASLDMVKKAAKREAEKLEYQVELVSAFLEGEASEVAITCVKAIKENPEKVFIWGGETTVNLPENAGKGGRNQHLALAAAIAMQGENAMVLLSAGTDGSDGVSTATGALVNNKTVSLAENAGLDVAQFLKQADSNTLFKKLNEKNNCLIETGATGTNVMDLVIAYSASIV